MPTTWTYERGFVARYRDDQYVVVPDQIVDDQKQHDRDETIFPAHLCTMAGKSLRDTPVQVKLDGEAYGLWTPGTGDMIVKDA